MGPTADFTRRSLLAAPAILSLTAAASACAQGNDASPSNGSRTLVVYFTRSGNTRVIAGTLCRAVGAALFEIRPLRPYPEDYEQTVEQARQERDRGHEPALAERVGNTASYDTVFLGLPIWGGTAPPVIRSFLRAHDLAGRTVRPFITHGGYGPGDSMAVLASHAPGARIEPALVMEADQERRTLSEVTTWLQRTSFH